MGSSKEQKMFGLLQIKLGVFMISSHLVRYLQHSFQCFSLHFFTFLEIWLHISEEKLEHCSSEESR